MVEEDWNDLLFRSYIIGDHAAQAEMIKNDGYILIRECQPGSIPHPADSAYVEGEVLPEGMIRMIMRHDPKIWGSPGANGLRERIVTNE